MSADTLPAYPVRVEGHLDPGLSRWLWLVKWVLVIPHYIVLAFLWLAFGVLSVVAFFAILFTGRYPRGIFDFNVGVLRWSWRVAFYAFAANGTDRYPPFALHETDYPATFDVEYPGRLSRGLVLVKWWLLAIPHYVVLALFLGGGAWAVERTGDAIYSAGLISILVLIAVVALLFTGRYPRGIFDLVLGMNRWVLRVAAYVGLMTDRYPPFRLDLGENEPGTMTLPPPGAAPADETAGAGERRAGGGRIALLIVGSIVALLATGLMATGGTGLVFDQTQRDDQGFLMSSSERYSTGTYALLTERVELYGPGWVPNGLLGTVKLRSDSPRPVFIGIGPAREVERYLAKVPRAELRGLGDVTRKGLGGTAAPAPPQSQSFWVARTTGSGDQAVRWKARDGNWRAVVMAADGGRGVDTELSVGATFPDLDWLSAGVLAGGAVLLLVGGTLIYLGARTPGPGRS
ncbi:MAG TPA: DUF4389 domain-containing protein [Gemmatimonadales bacterium]|nr:DUF4389 domain-containing protein [Gemmatimonadales bacterium]